MKPLVTIALPVYNGAATLKLAVLSILKQTFRGWELIILDDASTDHSLEVIRSFDDPRIRLVEGDENLGLSARLNMAVDMARGDYFARMDQDDISFPQRLEKQLEYLASHPGVDLLATSTIIFRGDGESLGCLAVQSEHEKICAQPWGGFYMPHPTWMGKTAWFQHHRYDSFADGAEDQHLLLCAYRDSHFACLPEVLLAYREVRSLKKMLRARRIFIRSFVRQFVVKQQYGMLVRSTLLFMVKVTADVLNLVFGVASMRNRLRPLSEAESSAWKALWVGLEEDAAE